LYTYERTEWSMLFPPESIHICKSDKNTLSLIPFLFLDHSSSWEESLSTVKAESSSRPKKIKIYLSEVKTDPKYQVKPVLYKTMHHLLQP
jgi:hypothetical protein